MPNSTFRLSSPPEIKSRMLSESQKLMGEIAEKLLPELFPLFLKNADLTLSRINQAIADNDAPEVKNLAHSLKGSSACLGITVLASHCEVLENLGHSGELTVATARFKQTKAEFEQVKIALDNYKP